MNDAQKITLVQTLVDNDELATDALIKVYLQQAKANILITLYPLLDNFDGLYMPDKYNYLQCQLAARYFLRRGAEGEISHNENGINRTYGSVNDADLLGQITPYVKL